MCHNCRASLKNFCRLKVFQIALSVIFLLFYAKCNFASVLIHQMNRKNLFVSNNIKMKKKVIRNFLTQYISQFFEMHSLYIMWLCALRFVTCKVSVYYNPNYYLQSWVYLYLMRFLLNGTGNLLAYVAALFVTSVCRLPSLHDWGDSVWDSKSLDCSGSQIRILRLAFANSGLISTYFTW